MAEAVAAFALAGNVLQFVEFATKFGNKCLQVHQAGGSAPKELRDLRQLVNSQHASAQRFQKPKHEHSNLSSEGSEMRQISEACSAKFNDIVESLDRIGIRDNKSMLGIVVNAFKATWNAKTIEDLRKEVDSFSQVLNTSLLGSLR